MELQSLSPNLGYLKWIKDQSTKTRKKCNEGTALTVLKQLTL